MANDVPEKNVDRVAILFVVVLSSFLAPFMASAVNVALPAIGAHFSLDAVALGWIVTTYILSAAVLLLPFGRLGDMRGRKMTFLCGMVVYAAGSSISAIAPSAATLFTARVINGAGAAMIFSTGTAILMSVTPREERGKALGWNVAAVYLGLSMGPVLGGVIVHHLGWRWIFGINAAAGFVATGLTVWKMKGEWADARGERFDLAGTAIYAFTLVCLMCGCSMLPSRNGALLLMASLLGFVLFVKWELRVQSPLFDIATFRSNAVFALASTAALINYSATFAVGFLLSLYLQYVRELKPSEAGLVLIAQPIVMTIFSPIAGRLSDHMEPRRLAALGMALNAVGLFAFCFLRHDTRFGLIVADLCILGFGFALFSSPNTNAVMSSVEPKYYGVASGTLSSMRMIGQMLSMAVVMVILSLVMGRVKITQENYPAFQRCVSVSFAVFAALCTVGVFASAVRGKPAAARA